jgi:hypothetical protein
MNAWKTGCLVSAGLGLAAWGIWVHRLPPPAANGAAPRAVFDESQTLARRQVETATTAPPRVELGGGNAARFAPAMLAVLQSPEPRDVLPQLLELGYQWVALDPVAALGFARQLPPEHFHVVVALAAYWARSDAGAAFTWAARQRDEPGGAAVLAAVTAVWAESEPATAARFAADLPPGEAQGETTLAAVASWARKDPRTAAEWVNGLSSRPLRDDARAKLVFTWAQHDTAAAAEWLLTLPDSPERDSALGAFSGAVAERYPRVAWALAQSITADSSRSARLENIARRWRAADADAANLALTEYADLGASRAEVK